MRALLAALVVTLSCYWSSSPGDGAEAADAPPTEADDVVVDDARFPDSETRHCPDGMVFVPEGAVLVGSGDTSSIPFDDPLHEVWLSAFCIDDLEVTNDAYRRCVVAAACGSPFWVDSMTRPGYYGDPLFATFPLVSATSRMAQDYCTWDGKRVPTEAEWEKAWRGGCELRGDPLLCEPAVDARLFQAGDDPPGCADGNVTLDCLGDTAAVGSFPRDVSPYRVHDMAGNATEIVGDWFGSTYYAHSAYENPLGPTEDEARGETCGDGLPGPCNVIRGGSFAWDEGIAGGRPPPLTRRMRGPSSADRSLGYSVGFRCASEP